MAKRLNKNQIEMLAKEFIEIWLLYLSEIVRYHKLFDDILRKIEKSGLGQQNWRSNNKKIFYFLRKSSHECNPLIRFDNFEIGFNNLNFIRTVKSELGKCRYNIKTKIYIFKEIE